VNTPHFLMLSQQGVQDTRRVPKRGACAQLGLHLLQLRRAAGGHSAQTGENSTPPALGVVRRQRHTLNRGASTSTVANRVCSRRVRLVLERLQRPAFWAGPVMGHSAIWPHGMLASFSRALTEISAVDE